MAAIKEASRFFMRDDPVFKSLYAVTERLKGMGIPYAVAGGLSLVAHGHDRTTEDVDILVTPDGLKTVHEKLDGLGYVPPFKGSKHLRDTQHGVRIEFLVTGQFPGDGKPKPVSFPDPRDCSVDIDGIQYVQLPKLIELKLASGMTNSGRLKDLADVQELIRVLKLELAYAANLNPYVQEKFKELWQGVRQDSSPEQ